MRKLFDKKHDKEISKIVPKVIKDPALIPDEVLSQEEEKNILNEYKKDIEEEFKSKVQILNAELSKDKKSIQAQPGKPAIILK
jgi:DNA-directed RNA polymerase subunit H (RpoH/RPB5)